MHIDVSKFKVIRTERAISEAIMGADSKQYEKLWDYCETVTKNNQPGE